MNSQRVDIVDLFYVMGPHLPFELLFSIWEIVCLPKREVRHLVSPPPLQLEMHFHKCDLVSTHQICHMRFYLERECHEEDDAVKSIFQWGRWRLSQLLEVVGPKFLAIASQLMLASAAVEQSSTAARALWCMQTSLAPPCGLLEAPLATTIFFYQLPNLLPLAIVGLLFITKNPHWHPEKHFLPVAVHPKECKEGNIPFLQMLAYIPVVPGSRLWTHLR